MSVLFMSVPFQCRSCFVMLVLLITSGHHSASQTYLNINFKLVFLYHKRWTCNWPSRCLCTITIHFMHNKEVICHSREQNPQAIIQLFAALFYFQNIFLSSYFHPAACLCSSISHGSALVFQAWSTDWKTCFLTAVKGSFRNLRSL